MENIKLLRNIFFQSIFWGWNLIFLNVVYFGITPFIGIFLIIATFDGTIPLDFALTLLALIAVPTVSTIYGLKYLRNRPQDLMRWFYGVEAPLVTWCLVRMFLIRELTFANTLILGTLLVCIVAFAIEVIQGYRSNQKVFSWVQMSAHTLMLFTGIYLGTVLLFYALPVAAYIIKWSCLAAIGLAIKFFSFDWIAGFWTGLTDVSNFQHFLWYGLWFSIMGLLVMFLFAFSSALFVVMPLAITHLYINSGKKITQAFAQQHGKQKALQLGVAVVSAWLIIFNLSNQQPQVKAFNLLEQSSPDKQELLAASGAIRRGLINANLYPYRYLSTREDNDHIFRIYDRLNVPEPLSHFLQNRYNQLLSPFLYQGSRGDVDKSAKLYAAFFDAPIQQAERKSVRHAIQSTAIVDQAKAGLLNIDQKKVWLAKQEVNVKPHGSWADVEIHEVYENQTNDVEEILYYFSLPESAAITGLWLGDTEDLKQRFAYQVAPRGAAQAVYNAQVNRTRPVDPALLEQVGPGQYRLRAFPVPAKRSVEQINQGVKQPKMHLWLTYKVMQQEQGWALPKLAEKRNIFWTWQTQRIRDGHKQWLFADTWLEDVAGKPNNLAKETYELNLGDGYSVAVKPLNQNDYALPKNQKYALILDTSYSMGNQLAELQQSIDWWQENLASQGAVPRMKRTRHLGRTPAVMHRGCPPSPEGFPQVLDMSVSGASTRRLASNDVDIYLTNADAQEAQRLDNFQDLHLNQLTFYGSLQTDGMLQQLQTLRNNQDYDAVLLLTDEGSYELASDQPKLPEINAPLWMIHLGGKLPKAYQDATLEAIQNSNGGVATDLPTVIKRLATEQAEVTSVVDGYSWTVAKSDSETISNQGLEPIAARQLVFNLGHHDQNQQSIEKLDAIHQIAKHHGIVTPYSSMIVLVNDQQREQLKAAEAKTDRFEREVETGAEQLDTPFNPFESPEVSGVPEPDLWILLTIVAFALFLVMQKKIFSLKIK